MGELGVNKIMAALIATALGFMALHAISGMVFSHSGGDAHHGDDHAEPVTMSEKMCEKFAYCIEVADIASGAGDAVEEIFDLGLALASADLSKGERVFKGQCATCHSIDAGGANGTGPNLHNIIGAAKAAKAGFNYSGVLSGMGGEWSYENMNDWLYNPSSYARGTSMSFAGLRKDSDRANVIAYLVANTENPPAPPAPLETAEEEGEAAAPTEEGEEAPAEDGDAAAAEGVEATPADDGKAAPADEAETAPETPTEAEVAPETETPAEAPTEGAPADEEAEDAPEEVPAE